MFKKLSKKQSPLNKISALVLSTALVVSILPSPILGLNVGSSPVIAAGAEIAAAADYAVKDLSLTPGANETQLNFAWYSSGGQPTASIVQMAEKVDMTGVVFPVDKSTEFTGSSTQAVTVTSVVYYSNKVTATGLEPTTEYVYRYGDGDDNNWSDVSDYTTGDPSNYTFMFVGDPQIGTGGNGGIAQDGDSWARTLDIATTNFPQIDYLMSAGDQIDATGYTGGMPNNDLPVTKGSNAPAIEYDSFFAPEKLKNLPLAPAVGNHDTEANYDFHFNVPNVSILGAQRDTKFTNPATGNSTVYGGDYWYTYGDALYMVLNTNNVTDKLDHDEFLKQATEANPNAKWRIATFHHDIYGAGDAHSQSSSSTDSREIRNWLAPILDKYDIDLVFTGHDHSYARSFPMYDGKVQSGYSLKDAQGNDVNPTGTSFFTGNSATGSKYYGLVAGLEYTAKTEQRNLPSFVIVNVTENTITYSAYEIETTGTVTPVDSYTLVKKPEDVKVYAKEDKLQSDASSVDFYYAVKDANAVKNLGTAFTYDVTNLDFVSADLVDLNSDNFNVDTSTPGTLNITADLNTPLHSAEYGEYQDVMKLTFNLKPGITVADLNLADSVLTPINNKREMVSNVEGNMASVEIEGSHETPGTPTLEEVAALTSIQAPAKDAKSLTLPTVPTGFTIKIKTSSNLAVIGLNGVITPPATNTTVNLVLTVTKDSDNTSADTIMIPVSVPAKSVTVPTPDQTPGSPSTPGTPGTSGTPTPTPAPTPAPTPVPTPVPTLAPTTPSNGNGGSSTTQFKDIPAGHWAATPISSLVAQGILKGTTDGKFEPNRTVNRAEFVTMLVRVLNLTDKGATTFKDVKSTDWYAEAIAIAVKAGIVSSSAGSFNPKSDISREEMVTMLMRAYETTHGKASTSGSITFKDQSQVSSWAATSVKQASALGLINGNAQGAFQPKGNSTRAEAAQVVYNLLQK